MERVNFSHPIARTYARLQQNKGMASQNTLKAFQFGSLFQHHILGINLQQEAESVQHHTTLRRNVGQQGLQLLAQKGVFSS
jgi:hypothetical protein